MIIVMSPVIAAVFVSGTLFIDGVSPDLISTSLTPFHYLNSHQVDSFTICSFRNLNCFFPAPPIPTHLT